MNVQPEVASSISLYIHPTGSPFTVILSVALRLTSEKRHGESIHANVQDATIQALLRKRCHGDDEFHNCGDNEQKASVGTWTSGQWRSQACRMAMRSIGQMRGCWVLDGK
jgi:hypothetical protein